MDNGSEKEIIAELVRHLKVLRLRKGLSHNKLSLLAGITRPAVSQIESGKRIPTMLLCLKIARALGKNLSDILAKCERKIYKS